MGSWPILRSIVSWKNKLICINLRDSLLLKSLNNFLGSGIKGLILLWLVMVIIRVGKQLCLSQGTIW